MSRTGLEEKFYNACKEIVLNEGFILYDFDYLASQKIVRIFIMNEETNSADLEDCVKVDRALTPVFEENTWIPDDIVLEVSSPGVYRKLKTKEHFNWSLGKRIHVKFRGTPLEFEGDKKVQKFLNGKVLTGVLESISDDENFKLKIETEFKGDHFPVVIENEQIIRAQLEPELAKI